MLDTWIAVALALAAALSQAFGTVIRHRTAEDGESGARAALGVLGNGWWWAGTIVSLLGFVFQGAALHFGSLLLVQPVTVLSLMMALPIDARMSGRLVSVGEWVWGSVLTACVGVIVVVGRPVGGEGDQPWHEWLIACGIGLAVMIVLMRLSTRALRGDKAMLLGIAGGIAFAYVALFTKGVVGRIATDGVPALVRHWELYGLIVAAVLAVAVQQASFGAGAVNQAVPASTVTTPVASILLGLGLLGERFEADGLHLALLGLAVLVMAVATVRLSRTETSP